MNGTTQRSPRLATLIVLSALAVLPVNMFLPSLPNIAHEFQADYGLVSLAISGYAVTAAALQLVLGPLSDRFGRRPVLLAGLAVFVLASIGCLLAADIWTFLAFRMLQGVVIAGYAVSLAIIRDTTGDQAAAGLIGYVSMAWAAAPMLGPIAGGGLDEIFGWRASFWAFILLGAGAFLLCWFDLGETNRSPSGTITQQLRSYPKLLGSGRFWAYAATMAFSTGAFYAFLAGAPLAATAGFGFTPGRLGIYMGTITAGFVLGSFLAGRYAKHVRLTTTMLAGRFIACGGLVAGVILLLAGVTHPSAFFVPCALAGLGNGLTMPGATAGAISARPGLSGSAAGLAGAVTVAGGAAIAALTGAIVTAENSGYAVLGMMLASSCLALLTCFTVLWIDLRSRHAAPR